MGEGRGEGGEDRLPVRFVFGRGAHLGEVQALARSAGPDVALRIQVADRHSKQQPGQAAATLPPVASY